jgi:hypothetical protein
VRAKHEESTNNDIDKEMADASEIEELYCSTVQLINQ